jgi:hypothetical protein
MAVTPLSDLQDWELVDGRQDLRGRRLRDSTGKVLGTIDQMMVNTDAERIDSIRSDTGEVYPVGALEIRDDVVVFHGVRHSGPTTANVTEDRYRIKRRPM